MSFHAAASKAVDALFAKFGRTAHLVFRDNTEADAVVIHRFPDRVIDVMDARVHTGTDQFEVRLSELDPTKVIYQIILDDKTFVAQGEPVRDQHGLVLKVEAYAS